MCVIYNHIMNKADGLKIVNNKISKILQNVKAGCKILVN